MEPSQLIQNLVNGLAIGSVYAIFALGYTLIFSILGIINFAQGAVFTLGAYLTYTLVSGQFENNGLLKGINLFPDGSPLAGNPWAFGLATLLGSALAGLIAVVIERLAFRPMRARGAEPLLALVSSLGVALVIVNLIQLLVGAESYSFPANAYGEFPPALTFHVGDKVVAVRTVQLVIFAVSMVMLGILGYVIGRTKIGKALRAVAENPGTASLLGISVDRYVLITFFLSGFLGGLAGTLVSLAFGIGGPYFGQAFGLKGLAVIVLGGLGSIPGAVLGGLVIGLAEAFVPADYSAYKDAVAFALLFIVLLLRPQGLLGKAQVQKV
ncbi:MULTISPECIES: branched-chain amino acid ABC transporter permease [Deinococcus]|jgi:amino acid/amide ABC transporter membrane protein 1, HAAT family (TC 3.A.1.4.-)|nr:branched-chain amino acid ABC transporter permease [Deinococcus radiodurans]ANC70816.1 flagellar biosynthesis protein FlgM [Deinococcus radiodurans R1 = ATCC 13939 = DSM 20539]QIP29996.1 branched-chain amino acid ABC transporter permease [Deinococcus radiodurans]QIP32976.1 branched-chain amino acid ABC transporter permease [Deinococcus radiodurans]UID71086.1 flagellar biosynthesis protein FlgM [Deinococcus radiodurans R1 = ATCC 13939 = DSM 20539]